ncbi:MAG: GTPase Era [Pseudomonadota bacterium]
MSNEKCGLIAIIGEPNAGKSTLINRLVGGKVSIVTPKVQTTRFNIRGVCVHADSQLVFIDTPGIFSAEKNFEKAMVQAAWSGIGDADVVMLLLDVTRGLRDSTLQIIDKLNSLSLRGGVADEAIQKPKDTDDSGLLPATPSARSRNDEYMGKPVCLVLNKIDAIEKAKLFELVEQCDKRGNFAKIFMISALSGDGVSDIVTYLSEIVPVHPWLYPPEQMSDISLRLLAAEITREKIFLRLEQELPYAIFVETEAFEESDNFVKISQAILVQREGQKKIVIGDKGKMIKDIGIATRRELEKTLDKKIHLELFVKVKPNWKEDSESYRTLGLEFRKN